MIKAALAYTLALTMGASATPALKREARSDDKPMQLAAMCFKSGEEQIPGQMTKICYYDCLGNRVAITVQSYQLCPLNIER